jgi:3,4-dihydroxy 2-butanone 4-phosphate synthase/GTP cyclohydrolase II
MFVYVNRVAYAEHVALVKGDLAADGPVLVRMHALNVLEDVLGDTHSGKAEELHQAMRMIDREGRGVVVLIREPHKSSLSDRVRARLHDGEEKAPQLRDYGVGAQILLDLGVQGMILLSNTRRTIVGLEGYGLSIVGQRQIPGGEAS